MVAETNSADAIMYDVHPAFGMRRSNWQIPHFTETERLGLRWLQLSATEQQRRVHAFFGALLDHVGGPSARFELRPKDEADLERLAQLPGVMVVEHEAVGPLTADAAAWILANEPKELIVRSDRGPELVVRRGWRGAGVMTTPHQAAEIEPLLSPYGPARPSADGIRDRRYPALLLLLTIYATYAAGLAAALVSMDLVDGMVGLPVPLVSLPVGVAIGVMVFVSLHPVRAFAERWYART